MDATVAPEDNAVTLTPDRFGQVDRKILLGALADGKRIEPVFGPMRPAVAESIALHVRSIIPSKDDLICNAFGYGHPRRIAAYKNGRKLLAGTFRGYADLDEFPEI